MKISIEPVARASVWRACRDAYFIAFPFAGIQHLFDSLIAAIIEKKDKIERENEIKRRDSVLLSSSATPVWAAQADQEEAREKARAAAGSSWSCCQT